MALTEAESEAAASVAAALIGDFTGEPVTATVEAPPVAVSSPAVDDTAPEPEAVTEATSFEYSPEIPEDVLADLEEGDIDDEVERELAARVPDEDDEYGVGEDEDTIRERVRLKKRNEYLERELTKSKSTTWKDEAKKYWPLAEHALDEIAEKATSRRAFRRLAEAEHKRILPHVQKAIAGAKAVVEAERVAARQDGKTAAANAYGEPLTGPDVTEIDQAAVTSELAAAREEARKSGSLAGLFSKMIAKGM